MDKQELKNEIETLSQSTHIYLGHVVSYKELMVLIDNLDDTPTTEQAWEKIAEKFEEGPKELCATLVSALPPYNLSEKPEIPQFMADCIRGFRILDVTDLDIIGLYFSKEIEKKCEQWITDNFNDFIKALVNGYTEKAPVWIVKAPYDRYFGGFLEKGQHAEINFSHINRDNAQKFEDKEKAEAAAILVDGEVEEWSEKDEQ